MAVQANQALLASLPERQHIIRFWRTTEDLHSLQYVSRHALAPIVP